VAPVKFVPVITTEVPVPPEAGVKEVIVGAGVDPLAALVVVVVFVMEDVDVVGVEVVVVVVDKIVVVTLVREKMELEAAVPLVVVTLMTPLVPLPTTAVI